MRAVEKVSVSLTAEELAWAKRRAQRELMSLSAVVSEALRRQRQAEAGGRLLKNLGTEDITERDLDSLRRELRLKPSRKKKANSSQRARKS